MINALYILISGAQFRTFVLILDKMCFFYVMLYLYGNIYSPSIRMLFWYVLVRQFYTWRQDFITRKYIINLPLYIKFGRDMVDS